VDGLDATEKVVEMVVKSPHYDQLRVLMLNGITFAGFNIVDIKRLFELDARPVLAITKKTHLEEMEKAVKNLPAWEKRMEAIRNAGEITQLKTRGVSPSTYRWQKYPKRTLRRSYQLVAPEAAFQRLSEWHISSPPVCPKPVHEQNEKV